MDIVWNKASRLRALVRIREGLGIQQDSRPEITGLILVVTGVGSRAQNSLFLAVRAALVIVLMAGTVIILGSFPPLSPYGLVWWLALALACTFATLFSVTFHVLHAGDDGLTIVGITKFRYRVKGVVFQDTPARGVIEIRRSVPGLLPFIGRYRRDEGDVFFHVNSVSKEHREWLTMRFNRPLLTPPPPASAEKEPRRSGWLLIAMVAAVIVVGFAIPRGASIQRFEAEGVSLDLPREWEQLPLNSGDPWNLIHARDGLREMGVFSRLVLPDHKVSSAADEYISFLEDRGWRVVSRHPTTVDHNPAIAVVVEHAERGYRSLNIFWRDGDRVWTTLWDAIITDYEEAEPVFEAAMKTVQTESDIPES